jgi:ABC-type bacteriocin/lantibiotic exporter with double-glycine peptidase domain
MLKNIGFIDKIIRISIALILIILAIILNMWWLFLIALVPFLTAFIGFCPLYAPFKINTNKKKQGKNK